MCRHSLRIIHLKLKFVFSTAILFLLLSNLSAQSKKEQIEILKQRIDSLNTILSAEVSKNLSREKNMDLKVDSIGKEIKFLKTKRSEISTDCDNVNLELKSLKTRSKLLELELVECLKNNNKKYEMVLAKVENLILKMDSVKMANNKTLIDSLIKNQLVFVEGGSFMMGSNVSEKEKTPFYTDEMPVHWVPINSFYIGKFEVTQSQWKAVMGNNPSIFSDCDSCPVENLTWDEVQVFIRKLNIETHKSFRLPTEAEWEYAARGGVKSKGFIYSGSNNSYDVAVHQYSGLETRVVGSLEPNELGIYDMSGNVEEWCQDLYEDYNGSNEKGSLEASQNKFRVYRGGSYNSPSLFCRSTCRKKFYQDSKYNGAGFGFRLVLPVSP